MRKIILAILGTALISASAVQVAAAAERHHARKPVQTSTQVNQSFRESNDAIWARSQDQRDWSPYENRAGAGAVAH
jgi:hypothetical protein